MNTENKKRVDQLVNEKREYFEDLGSQNNAGTFKGLATHSESKGKFFLAVYETAIIGIETLSDWKEPTFIKHIFQPETGGNSELETRFSNIQRAQNRGFLDKYDLRELSTRATAKVLEDELKIPVRTDGKISGTNFLIDARRTIAENAERIKDELKSIFGTMQGARNYFRYYWLGVSGSRGGYGIQKTGKTYLKFYAEQPTRVLQLALEGYHKRAYKYEEAKTLFDESGSGRSFEHSYNIELETENISIEQYSNGDFKLKAPSDVLQFVAEEMEEITRFYRAMNSNKNTDHSGNRHLF